jgi:hypothetical protein
MKKAFRKNLIPKIVSLLLATAIWFLIREHLGKQVDWFGPGREPSRPPSEQQGEDPP